MHLPEKRQLRFIITIMRTFLIDESEQMKQLNKYNS